MNFPSKFKNKKTDLLILLVLTGVIVFFFFRPTGTEKQAGVVELPAAPLIEISSLSAVVSRVDVKDNAIFVQHPIEQKEIKVLLNNQTEIFKLEFPFDPKNPPKEMVFTPKLKKIALNSLEPGNHILVETDENIYQKDEFDTVKRIQVLP